MPRSVLRNRTPTSGENTPVDLGVLFISGYTADIINKKGIFKEGIRLMSRPLSPYELLRKIREMLDKKNNRAIHGSARSRFEQACIARHGENACGSG